MARVLISVAALAVLGAGLAGGCADEPVAAWAERVAGHRASASAREAAGDLAGARHELEHALTLAPPERAPAQAPQLLQDVAFALGGLQLEAGEVAAAEATASRGLALSATPSVFRANLLGLRAMAREARGEVEGALDDYGEALRMHKALFDEALTEDGARPAPEGGP